MSIISESKLDFWIKHNYNVLFVGKHGVGKTHSIIDAFNRNNLNWLYFSASTLDPFVDLIGVPKEVVDDNGNRYLDLVRPKALQNDEVEAIFFDEYNRSKPKVRNAVMELIQFKSINGKKFNNLKVIWAAINPDDENEDELKYDVETLDPAQKDRFHVIVNVPYSVDKSYLVNKYGDYVGSGATEWWNGLTKELKDLCSPRRLDYALNVYNNGGDMYDVLDKKLNVTKLISQIKSGSFKSALKTLFKNKNDDANDEFFSNVNNQDGALEYIKGNRDYVDYFIRFYPKEIRAKLLDDKAWETLLLSDSVRPWMEGIVQEKLTFLYAKGSFKKNAKDKQMAQKYLDYLGQNKTINNLPARDLQENIDKLNSNSTYVRKEGLTGLVATLDNMTAINKQEAEKIIEELCKFIGRSQSHTLKSLNKKFEGVIRLINELSGLSNNEINSIIRSYSTSDKVNNVFKKIKVKDGTTIGDIAFDDEEDNDYYF